MKVEKANLTNIILNKTNDCDNVNSGLHTLNTQY